MNHGSIQLDPYLCNFFRVRHVAILWPLRGVRLQHCLKRPRLLLWPGTVATSIRQRGVIRKKARNTLSLGISTPCTKKTVPQVQIFNLAEAVVLSAFDPSKECNQFTSERLHWSGQRVDRVCLWFPYVWVGRSPDRPDYPLAIWTVQHGWSRE